MPEKPPFRLTTPQAEAARQAEGFGWRTVGAMGVVLLLVLVCAGVAKG